MDPVSLGIAAVGVGSSILGGMNQKKAAKKAAKEQANLTFSQRQEEIRMKTKENRRVEGSTTAATYASNVLNTGSAVTYLDDMKYENMREVTRARAAAENERQAIKAGARGTGKPLFYQAAGDVIGFAARAYADRSPTAPSPSYGGTPSADVAPAYRSADSGGGGIYNSAPGTGDSMNATA